jgi:hypothetical protein
VKDNLVIHLDRITLRSKFITIGAYFYMAAMVTEDSGSFFDVSDTAKETATGTSLTVSMSGSYIVGEKVSSPIIISNEGLPCDCDSCTPVRV